MSTTKKIQSSSMSAFIDISKWIKEEISKRKKENNPDIYFVNPRFLNTIETRRLNRQLGLRNINLDKSANNFRKQKPTK